MEIDHSNYARKLWNKTLRRVKFFFISIDCLTILEVSRISGGVMIYTRDDKSVSDCAWLVKN